MPYRLPTTTLLALLIAGLYLQCQQQPTQPAIIGTWKLLSGKTIAGKDTTVTDYTRGQEMIKIISPTHFAFMRHDLSGGKDSTAVYAAGGGRASMTGTTYTEQLDYFSLREWEGGKFDFTYTIHADTLVTQGIEKVEKLGINQLNIETYVRVK
jgi:hypothetical protein